MALVGEQAILKLLQDDGAVRGLVGNRIYPMAAPQGKLPHETKKPYLVYRRISSRHEHHMEAASGLVFTMIQIDGYAGTYSASKKLADKVRLALDGYQGSVTVGSESLTIEECLLDGDSDGYVPPTDARGVGVFRTMQEYDVAHAETVPTF